MSTNFTINRLSASFYAKYPVSQYPEIESKPDRPYVVIVVMINDNRFALPLRTNIRHSYCYKFKRTGRTTSSATGIDFTKAVIINDPSMLGNAVTMDNIEYRELVKDFYIIMGRFQKYINDYIVFCRDGGNEYTSKKFQFTTLKYFHRELGI